jgi:hypothetical protein
VLGEISQSGKWAKACPKKVSRKSDWYMMLEVPCVGQDTFGGLFFFFVVKGTRIFFDCHKEFKHYEYFGQGLE